MASPRPQEAAAGIRWEQVSGDYFMPRRLDPHLMVAQEVAAAA